MRKNKEKIKIRGIKGERLEITNIRKDIISRRLKIKRFLEQDKRIFAFYENIIKVKISKLSKNVHISENIWN